MGVHAQHLSMKVLGWYPPLMNKLRTGFLAEQYTAEYLEGKGYTILERNFRRPWGEIDVIAEKEGIVVFVEVKAGQARSAGFEPELHANREKMIKVLRTARSYLAYRKYKPDQEWQIDLVAIVFNAPAGTAKVTHFKNIEI